MAERRRLRRRYLLAEVKVKALKGSAAISAQTMNIHRGGIGLYLKKRFTKGTGVILMITFLDKGRTKVTEEVKATVRWCQRIGGNYGAGLRFEETINKENFPVLTKCLDYSKKSK